MLYRTPVTLLQEMITPEHFEELIAYDRVWGLERHREIEAKQEQPQSQEEIAKRLQMTATKGKASGEWKPKPGGLNRRIRRQNVKAR